MRQPLVLGLPAVFAACADVSPIEDGATYGPVTVMKDFFTSHALIETGAQPVMVDAGFKASRVLGNLEDAGAPPGSVQAVLLTHGHTDHISALDELPRATVVAHEAEVETVREEGGRVDQTVVDGDRLVYGDTTIEVFHLGAHTPGTMALLVEGVLLLGDAVVVDGAGEIASTPEKYSDQPAALDQAVADLARRLDERGDTVDWLLPSHSGPASGLSPLLAFADRVD